MTSTKLRIPKKITGKRVRPADGRPTKRKQVCCADGCPERKRVLHHNMDDDRPWSGSAPQSTQNGRRGDTGKRVRPADGRPTKRKQVCCADGCPERKRVLHHNMDDDRPWSGSAPQSTQNGRRGDCPRATRSKPQPAQNERMGACSRPNGGTPQSTQNGRIGDRDRPEPKGGESVVNLRVTIPP